MAKPFKQQQRFKQQLFKASLIKQLEDTGWKMRVLVLCGKKIPTRVQNKHGGSTLNHRTKIIFVVFMHQSQY